jgi:hypothetical protein
MKKLVLFAAVAAMVAFSSCSNKAKEEVVEEPAIEEVAPVIEETIVEEVVVDSAAVEAPAETPVQ